MKNFILAIAVMNFQAAQAQGPVPGAQGYGGPRGGVFEDADISEDVRKVLFQNTERDRDGVIRIKSDGQYTRLIEEFSKNPLLKTELPPTLRQAAKELQKLGYDYVGVVVEDKYRSTSIFKNGDASYLMYTNWRYAKAGASFSTAASFLNRTVDGVPAVLSLMSGGDGTAMWKCSWLKEGVSHEVYISDVMNSHETPALTSEQALEIAKQFIGTYQ